MMHSSSMWAVSGSVAAAVLLHYLLNQWRRRKEPPGPWGLPLIGYLPWVRSRLSETAFNLRDKYGDVISVPLLLNTRIILVMGYDAVRESLIASGDAFNGRVRSRLQRLLNPGAVGIAASQGADSESLRRFSLRTLKNFGLGRAESERVISEEFEQLKNELSHVIGQSVNPRTSVNKAVSKVTCRFIFGDSVDCDSPQFYKYLTATSTVLRYNLQVSLVNQVVFRLPFLLHFIPERFSALKMVINATKLLCDFNAEQVRKHKQQLDCNSEPADFIDAFLQEQPRRDEQSKKVFSDEQLVRSLTDLFIAGSDTTTTTLNWSLVLMAVHPDVQEKVHSELASTIGLGRTPQMQDRTRTPYTDAVLHELQRYATIAAFTLPHTAMWDTKLKGFDISARDTVLLFCLKSVHFDPKLWERPNEFYPEHFLDSTGTKFKASEHLIPFGLGRRACMGEALAKMELYLFFSSLFLNFRVTLADKQPHKIEDILHGNPAGGVVSPLDFNVHFHLR